MPENQKYLKVCEEAARAGGQALREWRHRFSAREKAPKDLVTEADLASQLAVERIVLTAFPSHGFLGEETPPADASAAAALAASDATWRWIVDPLDGTANYVHGLLPFCVSVALARGDEIVVGVIYDPIQEECFVAQAGCGASLNGQPLHVSDCRELRSGHGGVEFLGQCGTRFGRTRPLLGSGCRMPDSATTGVRSSESVLSGGGAARCVLGNQCEKLDVAAGVLIAREAGAIVTSVDGTPFQVNHPRLVGAATPALHAELIRVLGRGWPRH